MSSLGDRFKKFAGKTRYVVCRLFLHLYGQEVAPLIGIPASWFLPGLLRGIEGLSQPVLSADVLIEPTANRLTADCSTTELLRIL